MDSLYLVPYVVFAAAAILLLLVPIGADILVPVFLLPWGALTPDVGVRLPIGSLLFLLVALKYVVKGKNLLGRFPYMWLLGLAVLVGLASAAATLAHGGPDIDFEGGAMRNGPFRVIVVLASFLLSFLPIAIMSAPGITFPVRSIIRIYVWSVLVLSMIGVIQYLIFHLTGHDVIPLGVFSSSDEPLRSGMGMTAGGTIDLRPGSLAGEPKDLGMFATTAIVVIAVLGRVVIRAGWLKWTALALLMAAIYLTQSTSALLSLPVGLAVYFAVKLAGRPLSTTAIFAIYAAVAFGVAGMFLYNVAATPTIYATGASAIDAPHSITGLLYQRSIGRMSVEDFDWVILKAFLADPASLILGRGFGLGHLGADPFIPSVWAHYMVGRIIFPKTGLTYFLVNGGVVLTLIMMAFLALLTPALRKGSVGVDPRYVEYVKRAQLTIIPLIVLLVLRIYVYEIALLLAAALMVGERQQFAARTSSWLNVQRDRRPSPGALSIDGVIGQ